MSQAKPNESNGNGRILAIIAYIIPVIGGIIGLATNRDNSLTRNHAQQTIGAVITLIVSLIVWAITAYVIAVIPVFRPIIVAVTYILIVLGFIASLYYISKLNVNKNDENRLRKMAKSRLIAIVVVYVICAGIYYLSQMAPNLVEFAVPIVEGLLPLSEFFMPVVLLLTLIFLGTDIVPPNMINWIGAVTIINILTWLPIAAPALSMALFALIIALILFFIVNWIIGLIDALRGNERTIPIANSITRRIFGEQRKPRMVEAQAM